MTSFLREGGDSHKVTKIDVDGGHQKVTNGRKKVTRAVGEEVASNVLN